MNEPKAAPGIAPREPLETELLLDMKYALALVEQRIPVEGPAYTQLLRERVQRLRSFEHGYQLICDVAATNLGRAEAAEATLAAVTRDRDEWRAAYRSLAKEYGRG